MKKWKDYIWVWCGAVIINEKDEVLLMKRTEKCRNEELDIPLIKEEAKKRWFNWSDYESPKPNVEKIIPASKLPEDIKDIPDDILNWAIMPDNSENTEDTVGTADLLSLQPDIQKPFRIIKQELEFYRKHNLPIPRKHPDQRHLERMKLRNPRKLFERKCDKCSVDMKTTYSPDREEIVYCDKCYNEEIY